MPEDLHVPPIPKKPKRPAIAPYSDARYPMTPKMYPDFMDLAQRRESVASRKNMDKRLARGSGPISPMERPSGGDTAWYEYGQGWKPGERRVRNGVADAVEPRQRTTSTPPAISEPTARDLKSPSMMRKFKRQFPRKSDRSISR